MKKLLCLLLLVMVWGLNPAWAQTTIYPTIPYVDSTSPAVKRDRRQKITVEDLRQYPNPKPQEAFFVVERDGRWRWVDPLISQQLD